VLNRLRETPLEHPAAIAAVAAWQDTTGVKHTLRYMGDAYLDVYRGLLTMTESAANDRSEV